MTVNNPTCHPFVDNHQQETISGGLPAPICIHHIKPSLVEQPLSIVLAFAFVSLTLLVLVGRTSVSHFVVLTGNDFNRTVSTYSIDY